LIPRRAPSAGQVITQQRRLGLLRCFATDPAIAIRPRASAVRQLALQVPAATSICARSRTIVDFPAPLGPSMLMNMPRSRLEKGRSLIWASGFLASCLPAKFIERDRVSVVAGGEPGEQAGRDQHVIGGAVRFEAGRHPVIQ
jgi:hypothetical protein